MSNVVFLNTPKNKHCLFSSVFIFFSYIAINVNKIKRSNKTIKCIYTPLQDITLNNTKI